MILEVVRLLGDWLNDSSNGVTAQLANIQYDAGDTAPAVGTIADETRNSQVAQGRLPSTPGMAINLSQIPFLEPEVSTVLRDGQADVVIRVGTSATATENAKRDASYVLRAAMRSLRLFNASTRSRNGIQVFSCQQLRVVPMWAPIDDQIVTGGIEATFYFRDTIP